MDLITFKEPPPSSFEELFQPFKSPFLHKLLSDEANEKERHQKEIDPEYRPKVAKHQTVECGIVVYILRYVGVHLHAFANHPFGVPVHTGVGLTDQASLDVLVVTEKRFRLSNSS